MEVDESLSDRTEIETLTEHSSDSEPNLLQLVASKAIDTSVFKYTKYETMMSPPRKQDLLEIESDRHLSFNSIKYSLDGVRSEGMFFQKLQSAFSDRYRQVVLLRPKASIRRYSQEDDFDALAQNV